MTAQGGFETTPEAFHIVTWSFRETAVGSRVPRGSPQGPPEGAHEVVQEAPRGSPRRNLRKKS
eukprot:3158575-Pyramimonas_sp.AAC.1